MNAIQGQISWLPALLQDKDAGSGITGVSWNASSLAVKYQKQGSPVQTKVLTSADWAEGIDGSYNIRFSAAELDTLGLFSYWLSYNPSTTYPGAVTVVLALTDVASQEALTQLAQTVASLQSVVGAIPTNVASTEEVAAVQSSLDSVSSKADSAISAADAAGTKADAAKASADAAIVAANSASSKAEEARLSANSAKASADAVVLAVDALPTATSMSDALSSLAALQDAVDNLPPDIAEDSDVTAVANLVSALQSSVGDLSSSTASSVALQNVIESVSALQETVSGLPTNQDMSDALNSLTQVMNDLQDRVNLFPETISTPVSDLISEVVNLKEKLTTITGPGMKARVARVIIGGVPQQGIECWVASDARGDNVIASPVVTNSNGEGTFYLDPGEYWLFWRGRNIKSGSSKWEVEDD